MRAPAKKKVKRKDGLKRQSEIMEAALRLFAERGYAAVSIDDIIAAAGTARGTFYLHFEGKGELFASIVEKYLGQLGAVIETLDISIEASGEDLRQLYREAAKVLSSIPAAKHFVKVMLGDAMGAETQARVNAFFEKVVQLSAKYIERAQQRGRVVRSLDPVALSACIVGSVKELAHRWTASEVAFDLEEAVETAIEVYFRGMFA
jgi:AcrR family transcriptional regulator